MTSKKVCDGLFRVWHQLQSALNSSLLFSSLLPTSLLDQSRDTFMTIDITFIKWSSLSSWKLILNSFSVALLSQRFAWSLHHCFRSQPAKNWTNLNLFFFALEKSICGFANQPDFWDESRTEVDLLATDITRQHSHGTLTYERISDLTNGNNLTKGNLYWLNPPSRCHCFVATVFIGKPLSEVSNHSGV